MDPGPAVDSNAPRALASCEHHGGTMSERGEILWQPPHDAMTTTAMGRLATQMGMSGFDELLAWSLADPDAFWHTVTAFTGVRWMSPPAGAALADATMPGATWFPGATLNYTDGALAAATTRPHDIAIVARSQTRAGSQLTWAELASQVARCAEGLRRLGVGPGDRVAGYLPNIPEAVIALLATASLGAVWSSCAPESGIRAVTDRFGQISPKVLLAVDGYRYGTKAIDRTDDIAAITAAMPDIAHVIVVDYLGTSARPDTHHNSWHDLVSNDAGPMPVCTPVPFDHPLYILFSSGTTGLPKPIVHGHGGITVEHLKALALHHDLGPTDHFFWFTTTGWMMWNYQVSGLLAGATVVLFDGDPTADGLGTLWDVCIDTATTAFGASAPLLMRCARDALVVDPGDLRWVGSTGAPLSAAGYRWVHDAVGVPVHSISGGTDVCTAFVGMNPLTPIRAGEISGRLLGCAAAAFDDHGHALGPNTTGELVVTAPMPSMPVGFWSDDDGSRYRAAYFDTFDGVWCHGDWITFTDDGACVITGRSDATLNRGGVRLGTSDFYGVVEALAGIDDSLVVHLEDDTGLGQLRLFVVCADGTPFDDDLQARIRTALRTELSPRHLPDRIDAIGAVPRTLSGKKLEIPVKRVLQGAAASDVAAPGSLVDPGALTWFETHRS